MKKIKHYISNMSFMFRRSWSLAGGVYFMIVIRTIINTVQPFALLIIPKYILDELAGEKRPEVTMRYIALYAGVIILFNLISLVLNRYGTVQTLNISHRTEMDDQRRWLYMDYSNFENGKVRDLAARCVGQVDPRGFAEETVLGFVTNLFQLIGYTYIIISLHPLMVGFILLMMGVNTLITRKLNKIGYEYQPIIARFSRRFAYIFDTMISFDCGKEVRINGAATWLKKKFDAETSEYLKCFKENQEKQFGYNVLVMVIDLVQTVVVYGYCAYLAISGGITVGSFTVFLGAVTAFSGSFTSFIGRFPGLALLSKYVDDFKVFLETAKHSGEEKECICKDQLPKRSGDIEFINVSFAYPNTDRLVLKNVNIKIKAGERLSVVGYNGAGKSTFIKLICRLYEPTEGKILMDGIDISTINIHDYREYLAVVFQDFQLFTMTVRDNVILKKTFDETRFNYAIEESGLKEKIAGLENGIDTQIGRLYEYYDGLEFSGGEGQKLACARAYYKDAPFVILDEPTASLDPFAETRLYERFNGIIGNKTAIYISHRLSSVIFCDNIAVFVDGELCEYGTHTELMERNGVYADMFIKQAHYYLEEKGDRE